jgi:hypothetical protein
MPVAPHVVKSRMLKYRHPIVPKIALWNRNGPMDPLKELPEEETMTSNFGSSVQERSYHDTGY